MDGIRAAEADARDHDREGHGGGIFHGFMSGLSWLKGQVLWDFFQEPGGFGFVVEGEVVGEGVGL